MGGKPPTLSSNDFAATIPSEIRHLGKLVALFLARSGFRGTIPSELGMGLTSLRTLSVLGNDLTGPFPDTFVHLTTLDNFDISNNKFTGPILRDQWAYMGSLPYVEIYDNRFAGQLPNDIGDLISDRAQTFDIEINLFSGSIPDSLAEVTTLEYIYLSKNMFTGTIPENLTASTKLSLHGNNFTGSVPESVCEAVNGRGGEIIYDCGGPLLCDCNCTCA